MGMGKDAVQDNKFNTESNKTHLERPAIDVGRQYFIAVFVKGFY